MTQERIMGAVAWFIVLSWAVLVVAGVAVAAWMWL